MHSGLSRFYAMALILYITLI
ncbi:hypothetical protein CHELA40_14202 [Chelatococcus asaccharovorans]|nr:hypothetical protein CHELA17_61419 [Chelatococcus asaccharovorans]CAH1675888.1 hypothetical protein CHELA40_14202 [Chelatococcus asaccharovorans]